MRELRVVDSGDPMALLEALRTALSADGPAIMPRSAGVAIADIPKEVDKRIALVVETSGSSGSPKRVAISADALLAAAAAAESALGGPGQWLLALPTGYIAGIGVLVRSIAAGTLLVTMEQRRFSVESFVVAAGELEHPLRFTSLVPAQLAKLVDARSAHDVLRRFDGILLGGQSAPPELVERAMGVGLRIVRTYGSTETCGGCVYDGVPIGTTQVEVVDGQIEIAGPMLADGYLGDPGRTENAFYARDGTRWYRTADAGRFIDGALEVTGRLDDVFISGGVKVSLGELERFIGSSTELTDAIVLVEPHETWGSVPVVVSTRTMDLDELRAFVRVSMGAAAAPARIVTVADIPLLASGKPDRGSLQSMLAR